LSEDAVKIANALSAGGRMNIDELSLNTGIQFGALTSLLLDMEFRGVVRSCPGKCFELS
jgi:hypothetical protein